MTEEARSLVLDLKHAHILQQGVSIVLTIVMSLVSPFGCPWYYIVC